MDWSSTPTGWIKALYPVIKDRQLRHVVMPGSHDAGMGVWTDGWLGVPANTQTQGMRIYDQLVAGSRYFDLRIVEYRTKYFAAHFSSEMREKVVGGFGEEVQSIIDGINRFTKENPGEVIILWAKYLNHIELHIEDSPNLFPLNGTKADERLMKKWFELFGQINNRCYGEGWGDNDPRSTGETCLN
jgi:hypothetical protein